MVQRILSNKSSHLVAEEATEKFKPVFAKTFYTGWFLFGFFFFFSKELLPICLFFFFFSLFRVLKYDQMTVKNFQHFRLAARFYEISKILPISGTSRISFYFVFYSCFYVFFNFKHLRTLKDLITKQLLLL